MTSEARASNRGEHYICALHMAWVGLGEFLRDDDSDERVHGVG
jgi:hypothetical protein